MPTYSPAEALRRHANDRPHHVALLHEDRRCTYAELSDQANRVAGALADRGVSPGDRVALVAGNSVEFVAALYGIWGAGAIAVGINPRLSTDDAAYQLQDSGTRLVVADAASSALVSAAAPDLAGLSLDEAVAFTHPVTPAPGDLDADATIFYTSGTTGRPKGAVHTHRALTTQAIAMTEFYELTPDDVIVSCLPLCLLSVLMGGPVSSIHLGSTCRIVTRFDVADVCDRIAQDQAAFAIVVPVFFFDTLRLLDEGADLDLSSLRVLHFGGSPISAELRAAAETRLGVTASQAYGATECPNIVVGEGLAPDRTVESTGRPLPFARVRIVDDRRHDVPPGEIGHVLLGPNPDAEHPFIPMDRYWERPEESAAALPDGWLDLGDLGRLNPDGTLTLVGREKDLIIRGGLNVYPSELERALSADDRVAAAAVVAHAHDRLGEVPVAYVILNETGAGEAVLRAANEQLSRYKAIEELVVVDELPRNAMGKVVKRELHTFVADHPGHVTARLLRERSVLAKSAAEPEGE